MAKKSRLAGGAYSGRTKNYRKYTPEEDKLIEDMRIDGASHKKIADFVGRHHQSISHRLNLLAKQDLDL